MFPRALKIAITATLFVTGMSGGPPQKTIPYLVHEKIGFASERQLTVHYRKHGREFGKILRDQYLRMAQDLRDRPLDMNILEAVRRDGVITRFDRRTKAFIAFERNLIIRTFFKPADGERYFNRQLRAARRRR
jgi:pyocin large subunit-like protein